jgi:hypothetical protein
MSGLNTYKWEVLDNGKVLLDRHLNFDVRYKVLERIITHKEYLFHDLQIRPSISRCRDGRCDEHLCHVPDAGFNSAEDYFEEDTDPTSDPVIGRLVEISLHGFVTFKDPDGDNHHLDLNWKRLRNMAQPIVDEQLAHIAIMGKWMNNKPIEVNLGSMMLDNSVVRFDPHSYHEMEKDNKKDLVQCQAAWLKKMRIELHKRGIHKQDDGTYSKRRKTSPYLHDADQKKNKPTATNDETSDNQPSFIRSDQSMQLEVKREEINNEENKKNDTVEVNNEVTIEDDAKIDVEIDAKIDAEIEDDDVCKYCGEGPCVWLLSMENMKLYDESEHRSLPEEDKPPNNIRRKKVYRQMFLSMNDGPIGCGVRVQLPKCVEEGARQMFPSPSFMGFKSM